MKVTVITVGALTRSMPQRRDVIEAERLTVQGLLEALVDRYGSPMAAELMNQGTLREGLALLVNGRNVLSLPQGFDTPLTDGDEIHIAIMVAGG